MILNRVFSFFCSWIYLLFNRAYFKDIGKSVRIIRPLMICGKENIVISDSVSIHHYTWLAALPINGASECILKIGKGSVIGHFNHIYATKKIIIGESVLTADKVYISDNSHNYSDIHIPIKDQGIVQSGEVEIGDGTWLGENVCVLGAKIGKQCIVGANAVVTNNIPDYCVAVGVPARIVKKYCFETESWRITDSKGNYI